MDRTFDEAMADVRLRFIAISDQLAAFGREIEPTIRAWVEYANTITEQQWIDMPESARMQYEQFKQILAEIDASGNAL